MNERTLKRYQLRAYRKWFDSVPPRPAAKLVASLVDRKAKQRRPLGNC